MVKGLVVNFGPALEFLDEPHSENGDHGDGGSEREFLARTGIGYAFHVGKRYSVVPTLYADFVDEHVIFVGGVNFGVRFGKKVH